MCSFGSSSGSQHQDQAAYGTNTPTLSPQFSNIFNSYAKSFGFDPTQWMASKPAASGAAPGKTAQSQGSPAPNAAGTTQPGTKVYNPQTGQMEDSGPPAVGGDYTGPDVQGGGNLGANATQSSVMDFLRNSLANNTVGKQVGNVNDLNSTNGLLSWVGKHDSDLYDSTLKDVRGQAAPQAAVFTSDGAPQIAGQVGADYMSRYMSPYLNDVVGSTGDILDRTTDRGLTSLRASRDAGSAFGDRANLADGQFLSDSAMNKGNVIGNLKNLGFTQAAGYGMSDADKAQAAATTNAGNTLSNNQYNAGAKNQGAQFNVGAQQANTAQKLQAAQQAQSILKDQAGLSQQLLDNIVTADGIDTAKANSLFSDGTITSAQLAAILSMAQNGNGYTYSQNSTSNGTTDQSSFVV